MQGMSAVNGTALTDIAHLRQSVADILSTPIGSRVMLRAYGSRLFELVDTPLNNSGLMDVYEAVITALGRWEPRLSVSNVDVTPALGALNLTITGVYTPTAQNVTLDRIKVGAS